MPTKQQNFFNTTQPITSKSKWNLLPYFLYFIVTLFITIYIELNTEAWKGGFWSGFVHLQVLFYWGLFLVGCVSYFVIRRFFLKKVGFRYSFFVFLLNPFIIYILIVLDTEVFFDAVFIGSFAFYILFML